jgi:hypothetical protein
MSFTYAVESARNGATAALNGANAALNGISNGLGKAFGEWGPYVVSQTSNMASHVSGFIHHGLTVTLVDKIASIWAVAAEKAAPWLAKIGSNPANLNHVNFSSFVGPLATVALIACAMKFSGHLKTRDDIMSNIARAIFVGGAGLVTTAAVIASLGTPPAYAYAAGAVTSVITYLV